ncbi:MAG TPA: GerMN domain-containing protein [Clostridia bacterium]|nr:GerMN domain-containing protein [Clostridia bacterium]
MTPKHHPSARTALLALAALLLLTLSGCALLPSVGIGEDSVREDLPAIDPEAGVAREIQVKLFYRLADEAYLVGVTSTLTVLSSERPEKAMVRELLSGVPPLANNVSEVIPANTRIVDVSLDGAILYVTLSGDFFDTAILDDAERENGQSLSAGFISKEEYDARVEAARKEMYLCRRLAVCSIVNTITSYDPNVRVHLLFDLDGSGAGARVSREELGFPPNEQANSDLLEPMEYDAEAVLSPLTLAKCALDRMMSGEYEKAYVLFAETESGGMQKPTYANFETEMLSMGRITGYTLYSYRIDAAAGVAYVLSDLEITDAAGNARTVANVEVPLRGEGNLYKLGYYAFKAIMEGASG